MRHFLVLVTGSPTHSQAHLSAIRFVSAALAKGNKISQIFFYQDAVHVANKMILKPQDEAQLMAQWKAISNKHNIELQVCVAAANRRGVINEEEASINNIDSTSIDSDFKILGLGQLASRLNDVSTKLIQFK